MFVIAGITEKKIYLLKMVMCTGIILFFQLTEKTRKLLLLLLLLIIIIIMLLVVYTQQSSHSIVVCVGMLGLEREAYQSVLAPVLISRTVTST